MLRILSVLGIVCLLAQGAIPAEPALTIYNQSFAVVREKAKLLLKEGINQVHFTDITAQLEPESVILRDPSGQRALQILEQNYQSNLLSEGLLLSKYECRTIDFVSQRGDKLEIVKGKIIRSGYTRQPLGIRYETQPYPAPAAAVARYGNLSFGTLPAQAIIEVEGQWRFGLPGTPLFPALAEGAILRPTLDWIIRAEKAGALDAELSYVTGGMNWQADYNVVAPPKGDILELVGWVTAENHSGRTFQDAKIKLMAGDVSKVQPERMGVAAGVAGGAFAMGVGRPPVSEKPFEEYHLYTLERPTTLRDGETKQVEFLRASGVKSRTIYVYDGLKLPASPYNELQPGLPPAKSRLWHRLEPQGLGDAGIRQRQQQ